uniref:Uncharacterized protein n=2 Tax=Oryza TaxID=4527 RepID=A0A0D3G8G9_9ORYZ
MGLCPCRVCLWGLRVTRNPACMRAAYVRGVGMRRKEDDEAIDDRRCIAGRPLMVADASLEDWEAVSR